MIFGAIAAIGQKNLKRLIAYSSIGHMGYALAGLAVGTNLGIQNYCGYLGSYIAGTMIFFFGALNCLIPILMLLCGVSLFSGKRIWLPRYTDFLYLLILLSACSLFYKTFEHDVVFGKEIVSGGIVGESLSTFLNMYLGKLSFNLKAFIVSDNLSVSIEL